MKYGTRSGAFSAGELAQFLRDGEPRTLSELARLTELSRSTTKQRVDELVRIGLVISTGDAISTGGRPSARFRLNTEGWLIVGIDLGATHCVVGLLDLSGRIIAQERHDIDIAAGPVAVLEDAAARAAELLRTAGRTRDEVAAIGIGLPGPVEHASGRPIEPPIMPGWHNFDVPGYMAQHFAVPTVVDNDVNIAALGEQMTAWTETTDLIYLKVATGIGAGIISGGELQRGAQGTAGDIGHVRVAAGARHVCRCGNVGCLEATASGAAMGRDLRARGLAADGNAAIVELARQGEVQTTQILRESGRVIGEVLTACVSLMNPSVIVVGGSIAQAGEHLLAGIREVVYNQSMPLATRDLAIVRSKTGADAALLGAGVLAANHVLSPEYVQSRLVPAEDPAYARPA